MQTTEQRKAKAKKAAARSAAIRTVWTPEKEEFLRENYGVMTLVALCRHLRIADTTIRKKMRAWGVSRKRRNEMNIPKPKRESNQLTIKNRSEYELFLVRRSEALMAWPATGPAPKTMLGKCRAEQPAIRRELIGLDLEVAA